MRSDPICRIALRAPPRSIHACTARARIASTACVQRHEQRAGGHSLDSPRAVRDMDMRRSHVEHIEREQLLTEHTRRNVELLGVRTRRTHHLDPQRRGIGTHRPSMSPAAHAHNARPHTACDFDRSALGSAVDALDAQGSTPLRHCVELRRGPDLGLTANAANDLPARPDHRRDWRDTPTSAAIPASRAKAPEPITARGVKHLLRLTCQASPETGHSGSRSFVFLLRMKVNSGVDAGPSSVRHSMLGAGDRPSEAQTAGAYGVCRAALPLEGF
jgi:hypothetical protein